MVELAGDRVDVVLGERGQVGLLVQVLAQQSIRRSYVCQAAAVLQIAERAGLTKSTFFHHFPDKREVLFGGGAVNRLLRDAIVTAPAAAGPLQAVAAGLDVLGGTTFTTDIRESSSRRQAVIAAHTELREREALKATGLIDAITAALQERGVCGLTASLAAELGVLAIKITHERWIDPANTEDFDSVAHRTLQEIRTANAAL